VQAAHTLRYADGGTQPASGHVALIATLNNEGRLLGVANTHLKWDRPGTPRASQWGYRQTTQLLEERSRIDPRCLAWIICGDLNALPDSEVLRAGDSVEGSLAGELRRNIETGGASQTAVAVVAPARHRNKACADMSYGLTAKLTALHGPPP
jgi:endonuclease/exonuclease/phosphatase family metal-dependent hydrolase